MKTYMCVAVIITRQYTKHILCMHLLTDTIKVFQSCQETVPISVGYIITDFHFHFSKRQKLMNTQSLRILF